MILVLCAHCGSEELVKDGFSASGKGSTGKQRYRCRGCGRRSRENPSSGITPERQAQVLTLANERVSQRGISRLNSPA